MANTKKRPGDVTGRQAEILAQSAREEQGLRNAELSMLTAAAAEEKTGIVELDAPKLGTQVDVEVPMRTFRVNADLEQMTFGAGNSYTFEEGRTYKAPKAVFDHLEEKGYIWH